MSLVDLVKDLDKSRYSNEFSEKEIEKILDKRVIFPDLFGICKAELNKKKHDKSEKDPSTYLSILAAVLKSDKDDNFIFKEVFQKAKEMKIGKGIADAKYKVSWTSEGFREENKLSKLRDSKLELKATAYACEPGKTRIESAGKKHSIEAKFEEQHMVIQASGIYRNYLTQIYEKYKPQFATIAFTNDDKSRLLRNIKKESFGKIPADNLEKALTPITLEIKEHTYYKTLIHERTVNMLNVPFKDIKVYEEILGKPLLLPYPKQLSQVTQLIKSYGRFETFLGKDIYEVKELAEDISGIEPGFPYTAPVLSDSGARDLIKKEFDLLYKTLETGKTNFTIENEIENLALEHFPEDTVEDIISTILDDFDSYIDILKKHGYKKEKNFENKIEPEIAKYAHLLEFLKNSYEDNPDKLIQNYRNFYKNTPPSINIEAEEKTDLSNIEKLNYLKNPRLNLFSIKPKIKGETYNDLSIKRDKNEEVGLYSTINTSYPAILPIQEYILKSVGFTFK